MAALLYGQELIGLPTPELAHGCTAMDAEPSRQHSCRSCPTRRPLMAIWDCRPVDPCEGRWTLAGWRRRPTEMRGLSGAAGGAQRAEPARSGSDAAYKLYVSPALDGLPSALEVIASSLAMGLGVKAFKVGSGIGGLCRPDKLVVYFDRLDELLRAALKLTKLLGGCPAHGAFRSPATIDANGLLSWGRRSAGACCRFWRDHELEDLGVRAPCRLPRVWRR